MILGDLESGLDMGEVMGRLGGVKGYFSECVIILGMDSGLALEIGQGLPCFWP